MKERQSQITPASDWQKTQYANLIRYVPSGMYFARLRVGGKLIRQSLKTDRITVAKLRLGDLEKEERKRAASQADVVKGKLTMGDALDIYRENGFRPLVPRTEKDTKPLKPSAVSYYEQRAVALEKTWPDLFKADVRKVSFNDCNAWRKRCEKAGWSGSAFNHTLGLLRQLFEIGIHKGAIYQNPAMNVIRWSEDYKKPELVAEDDFERLVKTIAKSGSGKSKPCAELVQFMAFGGFRKGEAANVTWQDCDFERGTIRISGDPETGLKGRAAGDFRIIPMIGEMKVMLEGMRRDRSEELPTMPVMRVRECQKALDNACKKLGIPRMRHHDLRHLFATRCIESGVDIPTVSRWLGHKDGGALAMRVYGHLRDHHSVEMAKRVSFSTAAPANVIPMGKEATQ